MEDWHKLVLDNMGFARFIANHYWAKFLPVLKSNSTQTIEYKDVYSQVLVGMTIAAKSYDATRGVKYTTHASLIIKHEVLKNLIYKSGKNGCYIYNDYRSKQYKKICGDIMENKKIKPSNLFLAKIANQELIYCDSNTITNCDTNDIDKKIDSEKIINAVKQLYNNKVLSIDEYNIFLMLTIYQYSVSQLEKVKGFNRNKVEKLFNQASQKIKKYLGV